jgi:hypothetical protein
VADGDASSKLADKVAKLERKLDKQRRRLDRITEGRQESEPDAIPEPSAAERKASEIRRAVRRDRERFRDELVELLNRLTPLDEDDD